MTPDLDWNKLARELVRRLRAGRPQRQLAAALGYRSNVLHTWETGRRFPRASELLRLAACCGVDLGRALGVFYGQSRASAGRAALDVRSPDGVAAMLDDLRGGTSISEIARVCGRSRSRISRWLGGQTEPRLPDFLRLFEALSMRLLDFLRVLVDPARLPTVRKEWDRLEAQRDIAGKAPYTEAVLRAIELCDCKARRSDRGAWIADRLHIPRPVVAQTLDTLQRAQVIVPHGAGYRLSSVTSVDLTPNVETAWRLKRHWAEVGLERLGPDADGLFSYNVFAVSAADLARLKQMHLDHFDRMRAVIAASQPSERVAITNLQLFAL